MDSSVVWFGTLKAARACGVLLAKSGYAHLIGAAIAMPETVLALALGWLLILLANYARMRWLKKHDWFEWERLYHKTRHWKRHRRIKLFLGRNRCQVCGAKQKPLHIHHKHYRTVWFEFLWDTQVLCKKHHEQAHGRRFN